jgi:hypothetical protein
MSPILSIYVEIFVMYLFTMGLSLHGDVCYTTGWGMKECDRMQQMRTEPVHYRPGSGRPIAKGVFMFLDVLDWMALESCFGYDDFSIRRTIAKIIIIALDGF